MSKISYSKAGVNYAQIDPIKKAAQTAALSTAKNLKQNGFGELTDTRGESAYVWKQGKILMATVIEGLGTKNLVADDLTKITGKTYYEAIAHDTVASIINDLISAGATPLVVQAYWAVGSSVWLTDKKRMSALINGWKKACDISGASWGGGETPTLKGVINPDTIDLGGSAVGIIKNPKNILLDKKLRAGDRIVLLRSRGINMNGLSLARALAKKLPNGYATELQNGRLYGEVLLDKANIYAKLLQNIFAAKIDLHYAANITGHGLRKLMRGKPNFSYNLEKVFKPLPIFDFIQKHGKLSDYEMYETLNMGQDYALFVPTKYVKKTLQTIKQNGFVGLDAGVVQKGPKQVIVKEKNIIFRGDSLDLR